MGKVELRVQVDAELLAEAEGLGLPLDTFVEAQLRRAVEPGRLNRLAVSQAADPDGAEARARQWQRDSAATIEGHNRFVEEFGEFGKDWRGW
jgi:post-segregation antitoxin (ccd killing protein)